MLTATGSANSIEAPRKRGGALWLNAGNVTGRGLCLARTVRAKVRNITEGYYQMNGGNAVIVVGRAGKSAVSVMAKAGVRGSVGVSLGCLLAGH